MRTLKVSGNGKVNAFPDLVSIILEIHEESKTYDKCIEKMNDRVRFLHADIVKAGFEKKELKTLDLKIEILYNYERSVRTFKAYSAKTKLYIEFDYNKEKLNEVLAILTTSKAIPALKIEFEVKDIDALKNKALENAVSDSKKKAETIAKCSGIHLGDIVDINYSKEEVRYVSRTDVLYSIGEPSRPSESYEIEPTQVVTTDTITVLWEIKQTADINGKTDDKSIESRVFA